MGDMSFGMGGGGHPLNAGTFGGLQRKGSNSTLWANICKITCLVQMGGGLIMAALSMSYLFDYMLTTGVIIGILLFAIGAIGLIGTMRKNKDFLNFHIVGAILAIMLSFQFVGQVWREVEVDCALAELYIKGHAVEEITESVAKHEMFDTIYQRINEVEDMLGMVHTGVVRTFQMFDYDPEHPDTVREREFLQKKMESLKKHAMEVLTDAVNNPNITQDKLETWSEKDRQGLEEKLNAAEKVLNRVTEHEENEEKPITPEEYEELLHAITSAFLTPSVPGVQENKETDDLVKQHEDMDSTKTFLGKLQASVSTLEDFNKANIQLSQDIRKRRDHYNNEYITQLNKAREQHKNMHVDTLESMPEHCVTENEGMSYMGFAGICVAISQLLSIYFTLCLVFRIPMKVE